MEDHLARLYRSRKYAGIALPFTQGEMAEKTQELINTNCGLIGDGDDIGIVYFVTPGENPIYALSIISTFRVVMRDHK